ncbi:uncharacterized protein RAG0_04087 [Rhynchosporium agropyri]|uniref:Uncharacterized protein n=1 Tax=Rhynchosporium agropyri TaxID=914238 RepID=A0A1E1K7J5_9HELO|nr:uncharacterized protein RAG0_04087 [Rhynchosporium agropyri]
MPPTTSVSSEISNHNVLSEPQHLSRGGGMYTRAKLASMTPAHTKVESKAKASSTSVTTIALNTKNPNHTNQANHNKNPLASRRSNRLAGIQMNLYTQIQTSQSCPPSFKIRSNRINAKVVAKVLNTSYSRVAKSAKTARDLKAANNLSATSDIEKQAGRAYREIMKNHPIPPSPIVSQPEPVITSLTDSISLTFNIQDTPTSQVTSNTQTAVASQPQTSNPILPHEKLIVRLNCLNSQE